MKAVIMCGGSGTRLWPISRRSNPKQFSKIFNGKSLFQLTIERNLSLVDEFIIVVNQKQLKLCKEQIPSIIKDKIKFIIEPIGRNTAPAITLAALGSRGSELLILASDHIIRNQSAYESCIKEAQVLAKSNNLITFGIPPKYPETGYGYIQADGVNVLSFKEKPNLSTANEYLKAGNYFWNSGMFLFSSEVFIEEMELYSPEILDKAEIAYNNANLNENIININLNDMNSIPENSIDYAVMEKSKNVKVIASDISWSDLGSFDSLSEELEKDENGNTSLPSTLHFKSKNNLLISQKKTIATFNVEDLIIVDTEDVLLIGKKGQSQNVKELLKQVKEKKPQLLD